MAQNQGKRYDLNEKVFMTREFYRNTMERPRILVWDPENWLNEHFPQRWIGRRGAIEWPPRSPDMTPPDFFVWGVIKDKVYGSRPRNLDELRTAITNAFLEIPNHMIESACRSVLERWEACIDANGSQFEMNL